MRFLLLHSGRPFLQASVIAALFLSGSACVIYDDELLEGQNAKDGSVPSGGHGGAAGDQGIHPTTGGGYGGTGGTGVGSDSSTGKGGSSADGSTTADAGSSDARVDENRPDGPVDSRSGGDSGGRQDTGSGSDAAADATDARDGRADTRDSGAADTRGADTAMPPVDTGTPPIDTGAPDRGTAGPEILPPHGSPVSSPTPFRSECASNEVVTGFIGRVGGNVDAIGLICTVLGEGGLGASRNLSPMGNDGGVLGTLTCPTNFVAVGLVGEYGYSSFFMDNFTGSIGIVCRDLAGTTTQIITLPTDVPIDVDATTFIEQCTGGRYLTAISGSLDTNALGLCVMQIGGECNLR
jgi:hypothetical protein